MINFKRFWLDWLIVFVPTLLILLMVFILVIYPNEKMVVSGLHEVDAISRDYNASTFKFGIISTFFVSWAVAHLYAVSLYPPHSSLHLSLKIKKLNGFM